MTINTDGNQSNFLNFRISSAYQKCNEFKHVLTDRRIKMTTRTIILGACVRSLLLYSVQSWELYACELRRIESIWHIVLRKMVAHGFKRKKALLEYLKQKQALKTKHATDNLEPVDLDLALVYSNNDLENITKTSSIVNFCKTHHLKYIHCSRHKTQ